MEVNAYLTVTTTTDLVVDETPDRLLRVNFNLTLHQVPCEYVSIDVSDTTGASTHNITKDVLKFRLDQSQRVLGGVFWHAEATHSLRLGRLCLLDGVRLILREPPIENLSCSGATVAYSPAAVTAVMFPHAQREFFLADHALTSGLNGWDPPWCRSRSRRALRLTLLISQQSLTESGRLSKPRKPVGRLLCQP